MSDLAYYAYLVGALVATVIIGGTAMVLTGSFLVTVVVTCAVWVYLLWPYIVDAANNQG